MNEYSLYNSPQDESIEQEARSPRSWFTGIAVVVWSSACEYSDPTSRKSDGQKKVLQCFFNFMESGFLAYPVSRYKKQGWT